MMNNTTKRYKSVLTNQFENLKVKEIDLYQFGCEFEFYIDTDKYDLQNTVEQIKNRIKEFTNADILVD